MLLETLIIRDELTPGRVLERHCEAIFLCMNYVEGGRCHVNRKKCLLGAAYEPGRNCSLQGDFDVWVTHNCTILISDIGPPSPEPKRGIALGVKREVAYSIAKKSLIRNRVALLTTQRVCQHCRNSYWISDHELNDARTGRRYLCPQCISTSINDRTVGFQQYWCG